MSDYPKYPPKIEPSDDDLLAEFEKMLEEDTEDDFYKAMQKAINGTYKACEVSQEQLGMDKILEGRDLPVKETGCDHEWKSVRLVFSSVKVCKVCGEKE